MKLRKLGLFIVMPLVFGCAKGTMIPYDSEAYIINMNSTHNEFNILQLTDIHWSYVTQIDEASEFLTKIVEAAKQEKGHIDLIEVTGDTLFTANKMIATKLYETINSWHIPFAFIHGNHDYQGDWSADWINKLVSAGQYALFPYEAIKNDNVSGETNYVINVNWANQTKWQVYNLDSKSLVNEGGSYNYDYIRNDQVRWYEAQTDLAKSKNGGSYLPSITYVHIPTTDIFEISKSDPIGGVVQEDEPFFFPGDQKSQFLETALSRGMRGLFFGHDHSNDAVWEYKNALIGYGVKANYELYYTNDKTTGKTRTGGSIVTLKQDSTYTLEHFFIDNNDANGGIYDSWRVDF